MTAAELERMGLKACVEVGVAGLFNVRLLLGEDGHKRFLPGEVAERLGADRNAANQRAKRAFSRGVCMMHAPSAKGPQETVACDLKYLPAFLLGFDANRVRPEVRDRLEEIQEEMYDALAAYTFEGVAVAPSASTAMVVAQPAPVVPATLDAAALASALAGILPTILRPFAEQLEGVQRQLCTVMASQRDAALTQGLVSASQVEIIKAEVVALADVWVGLGWYPTTGRAGRRILHLLYQEAGMREGERRAHLIPAHRFHAVIGRLAQLRAEVRDYLKRIQAAGSRRAS